MSIGHLSFAMDTMPDNAKIRLRFRKNDEQWNELIVVLSKFSKAANK